MKIKSVLSKLFSSKGFTLIELLIVIAILGVLAAAVLVALNPGQRIASARNSRVRSDLASFGSAANIFNTDTGLSTLAGCSASYPNVFAQSLCGATYSTPVSPVDPSNTPYDLEVLPLGCTPNGSACTFIAIAGTAYADGVTSAGVWCWKSTTGTVAYAANDLACSP